MTKRLTAILTALAFVASALHAQEPKGALTDCGYEHSLAAIVLANSEFLDIDPATATILCNLPYAARGRVFSDESLNDYFSAQWWYRPDATGQCEAQMPLTLREYRMLGALLRQLAK